MDYTNSDSYATDAGTGRRMHLQAQAVPTAVSDSDLNGLIWEALAVIQAAGLTPAAFDKTNPATYTQLLAALPAALASRPEMARSLTVNGYQKLPGGLILQWGTGTTSSVIGAGVTLTYPVVFPNAVFFVLANAVYGGNQTANPSTATNSNVSIFGSAASISFSWIAGGR